MLERPRNRKEGNGTGDNFLTPSISAATALTDKALSLKT
jgi:hypothetical protein